MPVRTGEIYIADLDPVIGSEQGRRRPVVVMQNPAAAKFTSTAIIVPLPTSQRLLGNVGTCFLQKGVGGLTEDSVALGFQLRAVDTKRLERRMGMLPAAAIDEVVDAVLSALGIHFGP